MSRTAWRRRIALDEARVDVDGLTAKEWAAPMFEYQYCDECGGDKDDHAYVLILGGRWFAYCLRTMGESGLYEFLDQVRRRAA